MTRRRVFGGTGEISLLDSDSRLGESGETLFTVASPLQCAARSAQSAIWAWLNDRSGGCQVAGFFVLTFPTPRIGIDTWLHPSMFSVRTSAS